MNEINKMLKKIIEQPSLFLIILLSFLGAVGNGLQNFSAILISIPQDFLHLPIYMTEALRNGFAFLTAGLCSTIVNYCINFKLLKEFYQRLKALFRRMQGRPLPGDDVYFGNIQSWQQKALCILVSFVFVLTGVLFGLTALAFGTTGLFTVLSLGSGLFVALIMTVQELETWFARFDKKEVTKEEKTGEAPSLLGKIIGYVIANINVIGLSIGFAFGLTVFLSSFCGLPLLLSLGIGVGLAFTAGAFTESYFYSNFIPDFCGRIKENLHTFFYDCQWRKLGAAAILTNTAVSAFLGYGSVLAFFALIAPLGLFCPPVGLVVGLAVTMAVFVGAASLLLSLDFWISRNANKNEIVEKAPLIPKEITYEKGQFQPQIKVERRVENGDEYYPEPKGTCFIL